MLTQNVLVTLRLIGNAYFVLKLSWLSVIVSDCMSKIRTQTPFNEFYFDKLENILESCSQKLCDSGFTYVT